MNPVWLSVLLLTTAATSLAGPMPGAGGQSACGGLGQGPCPADPVAKLTRAQRDQLITEARKRCRAGEGRMCAAGGNLLIQDGDAKGAHELLKHACDKGSTEGCAMRAELAMSLGDFKTGIRAFKQACKAGHPESCARVDQTQAIETRAVREDRLLKETCAKAPESAECRYHRGLAKSARLDSVGARSELGQACEMKLAKACFAQGMFEAQAGNGDGALRLFEVACKGGEAAACKIVEQAKAASAKPVAGK